MKKTFFAASLLLVVPLVAMDQNALIQSLDQLSKNQRTQIKRCIQRIEDFQKRTPQSEIEKAAIHVEINNLKGIFDSYSIAHPESVDAAWVTQVTRAYLKRKRWY